MSAGQKTRVGDQAQLAPQLYQRVEALKDYVGRKGDLFGDGEAWASHQELQALFQRLLLLDLDYALDKKAEVELWNCCFKNYITHLQAASRDRSPLKQKQAQEAQVTLAWFLETASGFYHVMLQEMRESFNLDLPFMRAGGVFGLTPASGSRSDAEMEATKQPHVNNCVYMVQHCLVHLGDLARYRSQTRQAESFYRHAVRIAPGSGQAYNQLALLEANRGARLGAVFFYVRSVALKYPFPAAATNLDKLLARIAEEKVDVGEKLTDKTFVPCALRFLSLLHHAQHLRTAARLCQKLNESLTTLVASESLPTWTLIQVLAVTLFLRHKNAEDGATVSSDEREIGLLLGEWLAGLLNALLLPVYTLKQGESLLDYSALPAVKLILDWIYLNHRVVGERGFLRRLQIWPGLCRMLNELVLLLKDKDLSAYEECPLPEDYDLQSYLPLLPRLTLYNYKTVACSSEAFPTKDQRYVRASRIVELGTMLASDVFKGKNMIACEDFSDIDGGSSKQITFTPVERKVPEEVVRELDSLELPSSSEDEDQVEDSQGNSVAEDSSKQQSQGDKTSGEGLPQPHQIATSKKRTNVAMAAIMRQAVKAKGGDLEGSNRQVSFKTPSPAPNSSQESGNMSQDSGGGFPAGAAERGGAVGGGETRQRPAFEVPPRFLNSGGGKQGLSSLLAGASIPSSSSSISPSPARGATGPMNANASFPSLLSMPPSRPRPPLDFSVPPPPVLAPQHRPAALGMIGPRYLQNPAWTSSANSSANSPRHGLHNPLPFGEQQQQQQQQSSANDAPSYSLFAGPSILGQARPNTADQDQSPLEKLLRDKNR